MSLGWIPASRNKQTGRDWTTTTEPIFTWVGLGVVCCCWLQTYSTLCARRTLCGCSCFCVLWLLLLFYCCRCLPVRCSGGSECLLGHCKLPASESSSSVLPLHFFRVFCLWCCARQSDRARVSYRKNCCDFAEELRCVPVPEELASRRGEAWRAAQRTRWGSDAGGRRERRGMTRVRWWWALA